ncbi:dienelactone hydrolase family protein [Aliifodinibius salicampi]|uniref:Dienelactone hydrolase family protein n=1 Tax=Fodinibius salicampi TaxID=1920655 RepID=A0ABT3Q127_9BACT|nr:dienelactone hydrolase family protein [Fodinibius salicampi]MCW9713761.1 dienelactone hydrolase family protein [Fodinibius salicampi]
MDKVIKTGWIFVLGLFIAACSGEKEDFLDRMSMEHEGDRPVENASSDLAQSGEVSGEEVNYATVNGTEITGYLAKADNADENTPGIIVIHEWWGLNDNIRNMTDKLAGEGYTVLAVDLYKGKVAESPDSAGSYAGSVNDEEAIDNLTQAYNYLTKEQNAGNIGVIGWCFGGAWSLQTALAHPDKIDATVIYYGRLVTDTEQLAELQMPVLGIFGAEDQGIPPKEVKAFESALNEVDVSNSIHIYDGAGHAFANPSGTRYQEEAAKDAWQKTVSFFEENLK